MGGAADLPQRSSSPLKRRASDLEVEVPSSQNDVDMIAVPESDILEVADSPTQSSRSRRAHSIDMLRDEREPDTSTFTAQDIAVAKPKETDIPPVDIQIKTVVTLCEAAGQRQPTEGDKVFLVSKLWLSRVIARGSEARQNSKIEPEGEVGPVDNSDIIQQIIKDCDGQDFVQLKHGLGTESFEMFPDDAWNLVMEWYSLMPGSIPIIRYAHNTNPDKFGIPNMAFEFHPPIFVVHRLWSDNSNLLPQLLKVQNPVAPVFIVSRSEVYNEFLKRIKAKAGIEMSKKVRVWRVPRAQPAAEPVAPMANTATPPSSRPSSPAIGTPAGPNPREPQDSWTYLLLDVATFSQIKKGDGRELVDSQDNTANKNFNGNSDLAFYGLGDNQAIVLDEHISGDNYVLNYVSKNKTSSALTTRSGALTHQSNSQANSGRSSPAPSGPMTRGRTQRSGRTLGTVGLSNLGNTCYMNSALQCVRSVEELTKYFLTGAATEELNCDNPLGNNGEVASAYQRLLEEIYNRESPPTSVAPRQFKNTIGRHAPSFSGYGQQDSQEFLGFLLDGLQEDLSRVKKKPYIEKPDSTDEMVNNPEAIREMAAQVWDITKKRDDSVIADLFTGMYKSTLVCPVCAKVSITFDPFNNLTLQLPIENSWSHPVYFFPLNDKPIIISVDMDKQGSILAMKQYLSKKVSVPVERLFVAEEFKCKFYKIYDDSAVASEEISANDNVAVYELESKPTNWPNPRKPAKKQKKPILASLGGYGNDSDEDDIPSWDDPLAERMLIPVFYRRPNPERPRFNKKPWVLVPVPHFIIVTQEEARTEDMIRRKILEKVATFTTFQDFTEGDDEANESVSESVDPDIVLTNGSDSSGESKVLANSIDSEDELVDVTMKESNGVRESVEKDASKPCEAQQATKPTLNFNKRRPKFIAPGSWIEAKFQNMFELGYFSGSKELVPSGWNVIDDEKTYPTLSSRNPQLHQVVDDESGNDYEMTNSRGESESSTEDENFRSQNFSSTTRMNEESSDEDELVYASSAPKVLPVRPAGPKSGLRVGPRRRNRGIKTYSRKGNQPTQKLREINDFDQDAPDDGPLIRLGEGIVVDWYADAFNSMFEADGPDDSMRGRATFASIPTYPDPELTAKRASRAQRRKNGITLDDCLNEFGKEEILSEMDTWYCPRCKEHRRATKKFELWKTPDILVMHLKRFSSSALRRDKLDVLVDFPIEDLDLTSRVVETEEGKQEIYDLFAVDDHWGGLGGGHYTAFAKNFTDHEWYEYNDSSVSKLKDSSRVVSQSAYLLFYRRRSDVPLGGPKFQQIINDYDNPHENSEEDEAEPGEDQGLVANSSLRGSSSALTGVGAAHPQASGLDGGQTMTINPQDLEGLPAYQAHENDEDSPLLVRDSEMNDRIHLQESIEDEGIDMSMGYNTLNLANMNKNVGLHAGPFSRWNFSGLNELSSTNRSHNFISGTGSEIDCNDNSEAFDLDGSDIVQHNSSASEESLRGRLEDFNNAVPEGDDGVFEDPSPVPDVDDDDQIDNLALHRDLLHRGGALLRPEFQVPPENEDEEAEEPATEIHVEEGEGLKID